MVVYDRRMPDRCDVLELRQYTLHPGARDTLIALFEREFLESQEALGMRIVGQFRDLDDPDRFVWLRGFADMEARAKALASFYGGPVWQAHRDAANATMIDSTNVLLLRPAAGDSGFPEPAPARARVSEMSSRPRLLVATIAAREQPVDADFLAFFAGRVRPRLAAAGAPPLAAFETEAAENTFPALPVRTGEDVFVWFGAFESLGDHQEHVQRLARSRAWTDEVRPELLARLAGVPHTLRLQPTSRSGLR
jgi:hypothetical protein